MLKFHEDFWARSQYLHLVKNGQTKPRGQWTVINWDKPFSAFRCSKCIRTSTSGKSLHNLLLLRLFFQLPKLSILNKVSHSPIEHLKMKWLPNTTCRASPPGLSWGLQINGSVTSSELGQPYSYLFNFVTIYGTRYWNNMWQWHTGWHYDTNKSFSITSIIGWCKRYNFVNCFQELFSIFINPFVKLKSLINSAPR